MLRSSRRIWCGPELALELGGELTTVAGQEWAKKLLLNFRDVRYLSSTGFAVLAKLLNQAKATGQQVKLCELDPDVRIGADIIGLSKYVEIYDHEAEAFEAPFMAEPTPVLWNSLASPTGERGAPPLSSRFLPIDHPKTGN